MISHWRCVGREEEGGETAGGQSPAGGCIALVLGSECSRESGSWNFKVSEDLSLYRKPHNQLSC